MTSGGGRSGREEGEVEGGADDVKQTGSAGGNLWSRSRGGGAKRGRRPTVCFIMSRCSCDGGITEESDKGKMRLGKKEGKGGKRIYRTERIK